MEGEPATIIGSGARGLDRPTIAQIGPYRQPCNRTALEVCDLDDQGILQGIADDGLLRLPRDDCY
jgi:hypothetical protein